MNGLYYSEGYSTNNRTVNSQLDIINSGYSYINEDSYTIRPQGMADYQLLYIIEGSGYFEIQGEKIRLNSGTLIIFHPNQPQIYNYYKKDNTKVCWVHFGGSSVEGLLKDLEIHNVNIFTSINTNLISKKIHMISDEIKSKRIGYKININGILLEILSIISRGYHEQLKQRIEAIIYEIIIKLNREYMYSISNKEICDEFNISISYFIECFKKTTGLTPQQYILKRRMESAKTLLENTDYKIIDIAKSVGFNNQLYFSKYFKKIEGISPTAYRNIKSP